MIFAALSMIAATAGASRPIHITARERDGDVEIVIVGDAAAPTEASYTLEAKSGPASGGNSIVQSGTAELRPGKTAQLATIRLHQAATQGWHAVLKVDAGAAGRYVENRAGDRSQ